MSQPSPMTGPSKTRSAVISYLQQSFPSATRRADVVYYLYRKTTEEDLLERTMPGHTSLAAFASLIDKPLTVVAFTNDDPPDVIGYCSLFEVCGAPPKVRASVCYCFMKKYHSTRMMMDAAVKATNIYFTSGISVLYGSILETNGQALSFADSFGFSRMGLAPDFYPGIGNAHLVFMTRDTFEYRWSRYLGHIRQE